MLPLFLRQPAEPARPLRDELLSIERLEERAYALGASFGVDTTRRRARRVFPRLEDNGRVLHDATAARPGDTILTRLAHGEVVSRVETVHPPEETP